MEGVEFLWQAGPDRWKDIVDLTAENEGWLLSYEDYDSWRNGFGAENFNLLVAVETATGKTLGSVVTALYESLDGSEPLVTVGMFFVVKERRGTKLGWMLFEKVLQDKRFDGLNLGLNGVPAMTKKYATRHGFDKYPEWQLTVLEVNIADLDLPATVDSKVVAVAEVGMQKILEYDHKVQGAVHRDGYLRCLLTAENSFSKAITDAQGNVVGFGNIRSGSQNRLSFGPLYAETDEQAEALLVALLKTVPDLASFASASIFPATTKSENVKTMLGKLCKGKIIDHGVMYGQFTKHVVQVPTDKIFSITDYAMSYA